MSRLDELKTLCRLPVDSQEINLRILTYDSVMNPFPFLPAPRCDNWARRFSAPHRHLRVCYVCDALGCACVRAVKKSMSLTPPVDPSHPSSAEDSPEGSPTPHGGAHSTHSHHHRAILKQSRTTVQPTLPRKTTHVLFRTPSFQRVSLSILGHHDCKEFMAAGNIAWKKFEDGFPNLMIGTLPLRFG